MKTEAEEIAESVLEWWKDAQYWTHHGDYNTFDEPPAFVLLAQKILKTAEQDFE